MTINQEQRAQLLAAARPLIVLLGSAPFHPHVRCIVDAERVELLEDLASAGRRETIDKPKEGE